MDSFGFQRIVEHAFVPFLREIGFDFEGFSTSGRMYDADFVGSGHKVSISYEPGDWALFVFVLKRQGAGFSDIDDRSKTLRLTDLTSRYMSSVTTEEHHANAALFANITVEDDHERKLLKSAKDLCLVLPKYLREDLANEPR